MSRTFQTVRLDAGCHAGPDDGVCVMELASMLAGEPFSDHPRSVSRMLSALLRGYNDGLDEVRRQTLKAYASVSVGTARGYAVDARRRRLARRWLVELRGITGLRAVLARRWLFVDPLAMGTEIGIRVRKQDDAALHARMLGLIDALLAVGGAAPPIVAPVLATSREAVAR
jgi:hypothetical protein